MKLSYKKALELKKAGFPWDMDAQGKLDILCATCPMSITEGIFHTERCGGYWRPPLEKLIEACGDFITLFQGDGYWGCVKSKESPLQKGDDGTHRLVFDCLGNGTGSTPDEAVTNLWLATRKK